jgi:hypothetical protein
MVDTVDDASELTVKAWRLLESQRSTLQLPDLKIVPALA